MAKYVFVTGGVVSGLGKGITAASIALLLKSHGYRVFMQKFDPYINVDPGRMDPLQHGEVFVTADGTETDLDLGHYERFIDEELNYTSSITMGKVYTAVLDKERRGDYKGGTVQIVPHVTNEIKHKIYEAAASTNADIVITEIGGTIGDIESEAFLEALRQVRIENNPNDTVFVHTTLVPALYGSDELKTKPTQRSVIELRGVGIQPDILVCRTPRELDADVRARIGLFCSVSEKHVISNINVKNIYEIPLWYHEQHADELILDKFGLPHNTFDISAWSNIVEKVDTLDKEVNIGLVGKYVDLLDSYLSIAEALKHAGYQKGVKVNIDYISAESIEAADCDIKEKLGSYDGIIVPGGFDARGVEGLIKTCQFARENNIPFFGLALGMQVAAIEFARNVCGLEGANSTEFDTETAHPVVSLMEEVKQNLGGTERLGNFECRLVEGTIAAKAFGKESIKERHRHDYEINNAYREQLESKGMKVSGVNPDMNLVEIIEIPEHKYFLGCTFNSEFKSRLTKPHPLFISFIEAAMK
ncbi:MAG: CTP synthase [Tidjanibacter sp.]|nr:CTP synthase [Tidjanibacter sp.]MBR6830949.1 CTP synthase [Tidjanibacter sp.]